MSVTPGPSVYDDANAKAREHVDLVILGYIQRQVDDAAALTRAEQRATEAEQETEAVRAELEEYKRTHPDTGEPPPPPPPPPPTGKTRLGSSIPYDVAGRKPVPITRAYEQQLNGAWDQHSGLRKALTFDPDIVWVSWKDEDPNKVDALLASAPAGVEVWATYFHEPEDNVTTAAAKITYKAKWAEMSAVIRKHGAKAVFCLMRYTLTPASGRKWRDWYPGDEHIDILGWDAYRKGDANVVQPAVENMIDPIVAVSKETGKPWALGETGSTSARYTEADTVAFAKALRAYGTDQGAAAMCWWDQDTFRLTEPIARVWLD